ncbi:hypothetical protein POKO110462_03735 [Pontibacter korlensis]|uniref:CAAX prenyl protease 2/Lysostaphin resistance protein A-like domain-containing protein n=1 Tax=Pontibacter korlensis TaxID=400092 RepID=A0A0E3UWZ5_9BACT|nr:CPBP family glutamic-type intramembrane protease [Pontibacter korlensis]AKD03802.1 hypothetical protein PKOR_12570 [Pontibacter korlensis]
MLLSSLAEEIIFRLPLVYSRSLLLVAVLVFLFHYGPVVAYVLDGNLLICVVAVLVLAGAMIAFFTLRRLKAMSYLLWKRHFGLVFYTSTALFALMHLVNYQGTSLPFYLLLILLLPKFIGGIFLGYTRLRLGLGWAVALHMFNNMVALLLLYGYLHSSVL